MRAVIGIFLTFAGVSSCAPSNQQDDWLVAGKKFACAGKYERVHSERGKELLRTSGGSNFRVDRDPSTRQLKVNDRPFGGAGGVDAKCSTEEIDTFQLLRCHSESAEPTTGQSLILSTRDRTEIVRGDDKLPETDITVTHVVKCRNATDANDV